MRSYSRVSGVLSICLAVWVSAAPASAEVSCEDFLRLEFFIRADALDVFGCLRAGADLNARGLYGRSPLHAAAAASDNPAVITALLKAGAGVNARDEFGETPLHYAAQYGKNPTIITLFLASGADPNATARGVKPRQAAAERQSDAEKVVAAFPAFREEERKVKAEVQERLRAARVSCEKWNISGFFRNAGAGMLLAASTRKTSTRATNTERRPCAPCQ